MNNCFIYGLEDPITGIIRYIGQTTRGMSRPLTHILMKSNNYHLNNWIQSLLDIGKTYNIVVIEYTYSDVLDDREVFWIEFYRKIGSSLLNLTDGGGGIRGHVFSAKARYNISKSHLGKKYKPKSEETRRRLSISMATSPKALSALAIARTRKKLPGATPQSIAACILARKGSKNSPEHRLKISMSSKGKPKSQQHVRNAVEAKKVQRTLRYIKEILNDF